MRVPSSFVLLIPLLVVWTQAGCKTAPAGAFQCINDGDCPPGCSCDADFSAVGVCESDTTANDCGGSCDRESTCPEGSECVFSGADGSVDIYACQFPMLGDLGDSCTSNGQCDPAASSLGVFCCLDAQQCGPNLNQCVENCSTFSSGGIVQELEGAECQDNTECAESLFCCLVPDAAGNCDFGQDQSCTCRTPAGSTECDGQIIVESMTNNVACTSPDVTPCSGCNAYCLENGFPLGSTMETCESGLCQCGCTYCRPN